MKWRHCNESSGGAGGQGQEGRGHYQGPDGDLPALAGTCGRSGSPWRRAAANPPCKHGARCWVYRSTAHLPEVPAGRLDGRLEPFGERSGRGRASKEGMKR